MIVILPKLEPHARALGPALCRNVFYVRNRPDTHKAGLGEAPGLRLCSYHCGEFAEPRAEAGARAGASERRPTRSAATARRGASGIKTTKDVRRQKSIDKDTVIGHTDRLFVQARGAGTAGSPGSMFDVGSSSRV